MSRLSQHSETQQSSSAAPEFSLEERRLLLQVAHQAIFSALGAQSLAEVPDAKLSPHLTDPRGVFTTLYLQGNLRGCVGYATAIAPLHQAVAETARAAAFEDSRFWPVTEAEARELEISLSILSRLFPIQAEQVEVGRHGLVVSLGSRRGLLLPQVPAEYGWDRETFLEQTCRKANLPLDAWRHGATFEAFTAEVFSDHEVWL